MKNGKVAVSVWENNREDGEDSATQVRMLTKQERISMSAKMLPTNKFSDLIFQLQIKLQMIL